MSRFVRLVVAALTLATTAFALLLPCIALAHEHREIGKYELVVGWAVEPAFVGEKNGLSLSVTNKETQKPVEGLEKTLKGEILFGGQKREVELRPVFRQPGQYIAHIVPTKDGDYRFRFFGTIEGTQLDETFDSADGKFNGVEPITAIQFPEAVPAAGEVARTASTADQKATTAQNAAAAAQETARSTQTMGIAGVALGAIGILMGGLALISSGRRAQVAERQAMGGRLGEEQR